MPFPLVACSLKQTSDIDWIYPLKQYIAGHYSDDPNKYIDECATLNNLRQDIRAPDNDTPATRDLLYRYYGQLELLDLRFPVDESHIKILFEWHDAFTDKTTSQYSLAYEKASTIFNIAAILSRHAAEQPRHDPVALKTAYRDFQASAGMFTYINENFLHAPSTDLSRDSVKTLTSLMIAQAQEVFLEKTIADGKSDTLHGLLAKLAGQAAYLYSQSYDGLQEHIAQAGFNRIWLVLAQFKKTYFSALANFYQATADEKAAKYGVAIGRLNLAQREVKDAIKYAHSFPSYLPAELKLPSDSAATMISTAKGQQQKIADRLAQINKDNDFIYHDTIVAEADLEQVAKMALAKATPIAEIYQSPEVQRAIGSDIFQSIVPMSVTESASLYDEEKAKLVRAENERVEQANDELAAALDYMKLPGSLNILSGGSDQDRRIDAEFYTWCHEIAGHGPLGRELDKFGPTRMQLLQTLDQLSQSLEMEESVCEKMRNKYGGPWTQQPSNRLTSTLRTDVTSYREALTQAASSDSQLVSSYKQVETDFAGMQAAAESGDIEALYHRAMPRDTMGSRNNLLDDDSLQEENESVAAQIASVQDLLGKLQLVKRERQQVLTDLKEKIHADDISSILILNKKATSSQDNQIFKSELDKFRPYQTRLLQATHKQHSLVKQLTQIYGDLLGDKRVKAEQNRYEASTRARTTVMQKYRRIYRTYRDLQTGLERAHGFYSQMKQNIDNLAQNVETFLANRKAEGSQLLKTIESSRASDAATQSRNDNDRLADVMSRMNVGSPSTAAYGQPPTPSSSQAHSAAPYSSNMFGYGPPPSQRYAQGIPPMTGHHTQPNPSYMAPPGGATTSPAPQNIYQQHAPPQSQYGPVSHQAFGRSQAPPAPGDPWASLGAWK